MRRFNDGVVQSRVDKRYLATAYNYLQGKGVHSRTVSELIRNVLEEFVEILCVNKLVSFIEETGEARSVLAVVYGDEGVNPGRRGRGNEYSNLNLDSVEHAPKMVENDPGMAKLVERAMKNLKPEAEQVSSFDPKIDKLLGKTDEKFESVSGQVYDKPEGWDLGEVKSLLDKIEKKNINDDRPRQKSAAEMDAEEERIREKDKAYEKKLKEM